MTDLSVIGVTVFIVVVVLGDIYILWKMRKNGTDFGTPEDTSLECGHCFHNFQGTPETRTCPNCRQNTVYSV